MIMSVGAIFKKLQMYEEIIFVYLSSHFCFTAGSVHCHIANIADFDVDGKDPLVVNEDEDSDKEDDIIKNDDNLFLIALANKDVATLEVHGLYQIARM